MQQTLTENLNIVDMVITI